MLNNTWETYYFSEALEIQQVEEHHPSQCSATVRCSSTLLFLLFRFDKSISLFSHFCYRNKQQLFSPRKEQLYAINNSVTSSARASCFFNNQLQRLLKNIYDNIIYRHSTPGTSISSNRENSPPHQI